jgi:hypothetical protein
MSKKQPKVEILYEYGLLGERVKEDDFTCDVETVFQVTKKHPDAVMRTVEVDNLEFAMHPITYLVIYRKLDGVKRVTTKMVADAVRELLGE